MEADQQVKFRKLIEWAAEQQKDMEELKDKVKKKDEEITRLKKRTKGRKDDDGDDSQEEEEEMATIKDIKGFDRKNGPKLEKYDCDHAQYTTCLFTRTWKVMTPSEEKSWEPSKRWRRGR